MSDLKEDSPQRTKELNDTIKEISKQVSKKLIGNRISDYGLDSQNYRWDSRNYGWESRFEPSKRYMLTRPITSIPTNDLLGSTRDVLTSSMKNYIFNQSSTSSSSSSSSLITPRVVFLIDSSKSMYFSEPFAKFIFNSSTLTLEGGQYINYGKTEFNISSVVDMKPLLQAITDKEGKRSDLLKANNIYNTENLSTLTDVKQFQKWEKTQPPAYLTTVTRNNQLFNNAILCDNINALVTFLFQKGNVIDINRVKYKIKQSTWNKYECTINPFSLNYKPEYSKYFKQKFHMEENTRQLYKIREEIKSLKYKLDRIDPNYYSNIAVQLQLNHMEASELYLSVEMIYNEWVTMKRRFTLPDIDTNTNIDEIPIFTLQDLGHVFEDDDNHDLTHTDIDVFITGILKMMRQMYSSLYYFTQMTLHTFNIVNEQKNRIYDKNQLMEITRQLEQIHILQSVEDKKGFRPVLVFPSTRFDSTNSKIREIRNFIEKEKHLPLILGTFLILDILFSMDQFFTVYRDNSNRKILCIAPDMYETVTSLFNFETSDNIYNELMEFLIRTNPPQPFSAETLHRRNAMSYNDRLRNTFGIFSYLSYYSYCFNSFHKLIDAVRSFDAGLLQSIYANLGKQSQEIKGTKEETQRELKGYLNSLRENVREIYIQMAYVFDPALTMFISSPVNLNEIISQPNWMLASKNTHLNGLTGYTYPFLNYATLPNFKTPTLKTIDRAASEAKSKKPVQTPPPAKNDVDERIIPEDKSSEQKSDLPPPVTQVVPPTNLNPTRVDLDSPSAEGTTSTATSIPPHMGQVGGIGAFDTFRYSVSSAIPPDEMIDKLEAEFLKKDNPLILPPMQIDNLCFNKNVRMTQVIKSNTTTTNAFLYIRDLSEWINAGDRSGPPGGDGHLPTLNEPMTENTRFIGGVGEELLDNLSGRKSENKNWDDEMSNDDDYFHDEFPDDVAFDEEISKLSDNDQKEFEEIVKKIAGKHRDFDFDPRFFQELLSEFKKQKAFEKAKNKTPVKMVIEEETPREITPSEETIVNLYNTYCKNIPILYLVNKLTEEETFRLQFLGQNTTEGDNKRTEIKNCYLILQEGSGCYVYYDVTFTPNDQIPNYDNLTRSECVTILKPRGQMSYLQRGNRNADNLYYVKVDLTVYYSSENRLEEFRQECDEKKSNLSRAYKKLRSYSQNNVFFKRPDFSPLKSNVEDIKKRLKDALNKKEGTGFLKLGQNDKEGKGEGKTTDSALDNQILSYLSTAWSELKFPDMPTSEDWSTIMHRLGLGEGHMSTLQTVIKQYTPTLPSISTLKAPTLPSLPTTFPSFPKLTTTFPSLPEGTTLYPFGTKVPPSPKPDEGVELGSLEKPSDVPLPPPGMSSSDVSGPAPSSTSPPPPATTRQSILSWFSKTSKNTSSQPTNTTRKANKNGVFYSDYGKNKLSKEVPETGKGTTLASTDSTPPPLTEPPPVAPPLAPPVAPPLESTDSTPVAPPPPESTDSTLVAPPPASTDSTPTPTTPANRKVPFEPFDVIFSPSPPPKKLPATTPLNPTSSSTILTAQPFLPQKTGDDEFSPFSSSKAKGKPVPTGEKSRLTVPPANEESPEGTSFLSPLAGSIFSFGSNIYNKIFSQIGNTVSTNESSLGSSLGKNTQTVSRTPSPTGGPSASSTPSETGGPSAPSETGGPSAPSETGGPSAPSGKGGPPVSPPPTPVTKGPPVSPPPTPVTKGPPPKRRLDLSKVPAGSLPPPPPTTPTTTTTNPPVSLPVLPPPPPVSPPLVSPPPSTTSTTPNLPVSLPVSLPPPTDTTTTNPLLPVSGTTFVPPPFYFTNKKDYEIEIIPPPPSPEGAASSTDLSLLDLPPIESWTTPAESLYPPNLNWTTYDSFPKLRNSQATCYANSVMQVLGHIPPFVDIINRDTKENLTGENINVMGLFKDFINTMSTREIRQDVIETKQIYETLFGAINSNRRMKIELGRHQSAAEFLVGLEEYLVDQLTPIDPKRYKESFVRLPHHGRFFIDDRVQQIIDKGKFTRLQEIFYVATIQIDINSSGNESMNFYFGPFLLLQRNYKTNLIECLQEEIEEIGHIQRVITLYHLPEILMINLNHEFKETGIDYLYENSQEFMFLVPVILDLTPYVLDPTENYGYMYELFAIIIRTGGTTGCGHYVASVLINNRWYKFDDNLITEIGGNPVVDGFIVNKDMMNGELFFYKRIPVSNSPSISSSSLVPRPSERVTPPPPPPSKTKDNNLKTKKNKKKGGHRRKKTRRRSLARRRHSSRSHTKR